MPKRIVILVDGEELTAWDLQPAKQATMSPISEELMCPWCGDGADYTRVWSLGWETGKWSPEAGIFSTADSSSEFIEHSCIHCNKPILLPEGF